MGRYVYHFEPGAAEGRAQMRDLLGVKGANLAEMARMGLNIPPGMTITTEACSHFLDHGEFPPGLRMEIEEGLGQLQSATRRVWGDGARPLLLSARSGAAKSMPGMMETVLNLGLTGSVMRRWMAEGEDPWFVHNCRRRLIQMYARVVYGIDDGLMEACCRRVGQETGPSKDSAAALEEAKVDALHRLVLREAKTTVPDDADEQLWGAVEAIFRSWNAPRVREHRRLHDIDAGGGTAVTLMTMVFGNRDDRSCSGIGFTRHPITGSRRSYGEYLPRRQGDAVAEGRKTPGSVRRGPLLAPGIPSLEESMPGVCAELVETFYRLERHLRAVQEVEFTVESGRLWLLQTRQAICTGPAAVRIALDMVDEGMLEDEEALLRVDPSRHIPDLLGRRLDADADRSHLLVRAVGASPGAARGRLVTKTAEAVERARRGESVVLLQSKTKVSDVDSLRLVQAIVTTEGGMTAHLAEVSRKLGLPCVCGAAEVEIAEDGSGITIGGRFIPRGQMVTVDGTRGEVYAERLPLVEGVKVDKRLERFLELADRFRRMDVRVAADELDEMEEGLAQGADGVGLCRSEVMIGGEERRLMAMRRVLLSGDEDEQQEALEELLHLHRHDLAQIVRFADGRPVTVRLMDAPLGDFLPGDDQALERTSAELEVELAEVERRCRAFMEDEPGLGLRGVRMGLVYPELYAMQVQALVEACRMVVDEGVVPTAEILIPRVASAREAEEVADLVEATMARHLHGATSRINIDVGVVVQLPRAAFRCAEIARVADFVIFDHAELTRWSWGMAREEAGRYLPMYLERGLVDADPFATIDRRGVGELIRRAIADGRRIYRDLVVGVEVGDNGGTAAIHDYEALEVDSLTVAPSQVVATRLAAAQAYVVYERARRRRQRRGLEE